MAHFFTSTSRDAKTVHYCNYCGQRLFRTSRVLTMAALPTVMLALEPPGPHCVHAILSPQLLARALFLSSTPGCPAVRSPRNAAAAPGDLHRAWVQRGSRLACDRSPPRSRPRGERVDCPQPARISASAKAAPYPEDAAVQLARAQVAGAARLASEVDLFRYF